MHSRRHRKGNVFDPQAMLAKSRSRIQKEGVTIRPKTQFLSNSEKRINENDLQYYYKILLNLGRIPTFIQWDYAVINKPFQLAASVNYGVVTDIKLNQCLNNVDVSTIWPLNAGIDLVNIFCNINFVRLHANASSEENDISFIYIDEGEPVVSLILHSLDTNWHSVIQITDNSVFDVDNGSVYSMETPGYIGKGLVSLTQTTDIAKLRQDGTVTNENNELVLSLTSNNSSVINTFLLCGVISFGIKYLKP